MPVGGRALARRVLAHRRDDNAVGKIKRLDLPGCEQPTLHPDSFMASKAKTNSGRILIIEDDWDLLEVLQLMLEDEGHQIVTAKNGRAALAAAAAKRFDVAVMDISMPEMSGIEVAQALRGNPKTAGIHIVFHTGLQEQWVRERFADYDLFLTKAEDVAELVDGIARLVANPKQPIPAVQPAEVGFSTDDAAMAQRALRHALGLGDEVLDEQRFVAALAEEIAPLMASGKTSADIAAIISESIGRDVTATLIERHHRV
ncbi:MAG: response regulator [Caldimonas sp.]